MLYFELGIGLHLEHQWLSIFDVTDHLSLDVAAADILGKGCVFFEPLFECELFKAAVFADTNDVEENFSLYFLDVDVVQLQFKRAYLSLNPKAHDFKFLV